MSFPLTKDEVKTWIWSALGEDEKKSAEVIVKIVEQHEIDGKLLMLLYKYPHEFVTILPEFRARLLLMNALDVLVKSVGKNLPASIKTCSMPTASLLSRLTSNKYSEGPNSFSRSQTNVDNGGYKHNSYGGMDKRSCNTSHYNCFGDDGSNTNCAPSQHAAKSMTLGNDEGGVRDREIPSPVPLPVFEHSLQQAINAGRLRERSIRSRMANACARFYASIKMYPTLIDYHRICERLVEKYPDLRDVETKPGAQPWNQLKKLLSMSFCNVRRIMKVKDLMNARHFITSIQKRYKAFGKDRRFPERPHHFLDDSSGSSDDEYPSQRKILLPIPPPIPTFDDDLQNAIIEGKLKDRPWSSQFYRRCAKFYTKLKPYPSRRDYKNISEHMAKVFPSLGPASCIKRLLSQYIRSHRQTRKLWKLDQQQKAKMLRLERSNKSHNAGKADRNRNNESQALPPQHGSAGASYNPFESFEQHSNAGHMPRDGSHNIHPSFFNGNFVPVGERVVAASNDTMDVKQMTDSSSNSPLQYPVPLPPLDDAMIKGIREGQLQERTLRIRFIRLCANFYLSMKNYPTKEEYNNICRTVITEFPDLRDPSPLPGCPPFMLFKKALTACIRNKRRDNVVPSSKQSNWSSSNANLNFLQNNYVKIERSDDGSGYYNGPNQHNSPPPTTTTTVQIAEQVRYSGASVLPCFPGQPPTSLSVPLPPPPQHVVNSIVLSPDVMSHNHAVRQLSPLTNPNENFADGRGEYSHLNASGLNPNFVSTTNFVEYQIPLPVFPSDIAALLNTGQPLIGDVRIRFLQTCANFYLHGKSSPNVTDVTAICAQMVQAFPQLADSVGAALEKHLCFNNLKKDLSVYLCEAPSKNLEKKNAEGTSIGLNCLTPVCNGLPSVEPSLNHPIGISSQSFNLIMQGPATVNRQQLEVNPTTL